MRCLLFILFCCLSPAFADDGDDYQAAMGIVAKLKKSDVPKPLTEAQSEELAGAVDTLLAPENIELLSCFNDEAKLFVLRYATPRATRRILGHSCGPKGSTTFLARPCCTQGS